MCIVIAAAFKAASSIARDSTPHRFFYSWKFYVGGDLRPRPLFHKQEIAAGIVGFGLAQEADELQGKRQVSIQVLMQAL